jgi:SAM-dependent methyltransferase
MIDIGHNPVVIDNRNESAVMTFWERAATTKWGHYISRMEEQAILRAAFLVGKPDQALEIGCDGGRWSKLLLDSGWQMTCIDVDPKTLAACQQKVPTAKCILSSPQDETIPSEPDSMGLLLCVEVAPVIQSDWFLPEAYRVLREHGILVGVFWNRTSLRGFFWRVKHRFAPARDAAYYNTSYSAWKKNLGRAGFQLVYEEGFCWSFFGRTSNSPLIPLFTKLERLLQLHRLTAWSPWIVFIARKIAREREEQDGSNPAAMS